MEVMTLLPPCWPPSGGQGRSSPCCRAMKANSRIPVTIFVPQFESVPSIVVLAVLLLQPPRLANVASFNGLLGMPAYGHALTFRVTVAQSFEPDRLPSHQKWTSVRIPRTTALSVFTPAALYPRPPGLITYWPSSWRCTQPVACHPYQASIGTSLPPAFGLRAAEFT